MKVNTAIGTGYAGLVTGACLCGGDGESLWSRLDVEPRVKILHPERLGAHLAAAGPGRGGQVANVEASVASAVDDRTSTPRCVGTLALHRRGHAAGRSTVRPTCSTCVAAARPIGARMKEFVTVDKSIGAGHG